MPAEKWQPWRDIPAVALAPLLRTLASQVKLRGLLRHRRGPKKLPKQKPVYDPKHKHYSTARLLRNLEQEDSC